MTWCYAIKSMPIGQHTIVNCNLDSCKHQHTEETPVGNGLFAHLIGSKKAKILTISYKRLVLAIASQTCPCTEKLDSWINCCSDSGSSSSLKMGGRLWLGPFCLDLRIWMHLARDGQRYEHWSRCGLSLPLSSCLLKDAVDNCIKQHRERRIRQDTRFPSIM